MNRGFDYRRPKRRMLSKASVIAILVCCGVIAFILVSIVYAGGFVEDEPAEEVSALSIAEQEARTGIDTEDNSIILDRYGNSEKPIEEMSAEEIWAADPREPVEVRGIYVPDSVVSDEERLDGLIALCDETELNAMVINVKNDEGRLTFDMDTAIGDETGAEQIVIPDITAFLEKLHSHDIYAIARIVTFKDSFFAEKKPEYACTTYDGEIYADTSGEKWINPYLRETWDYYIDIALEAADAGFDEVQFDYLRFSTGTGYENINYGSESLTLSKQDVIVEFTEYAYRRIVKKGVFVSADVYGDIMLHESDGVLIGQSYQKMAQYLDYICPMNYPSHFNFGEYGIAQPDSAPYEFNDKLLEDSVRLLEEQSARGHVADVRPWLQGFTATWVEGYIEYGSEEYRSQIQAVYDNGYSEWFFWNASGNYEDGGFRPE